MLTLVHNNRSEAAGARQIQRDGARRLRRFTVGNLKRIRLHKISGVRFKQVAADVRRRMVSHDPRCSSASLPRRLPAFRSLKHSVRVWATARSTGRRSPIVCGWLACLLFLFMAGAAFPASMTAHFDRDTVAVGESVTLTLTFEGVSPSAPPSLPPLPNAQVSYSGQSSSFNFVNGVSTSSVSFNYTLVPTQPGEIAIPALQAQVNGQILTSQALKLKVAKSQAETAADAGQNSQAFVKLVVPKNEVYVGESFPVEIDLYFQNIDQNSLHMPQLNAEGFSLGQMPRPSQSRTQIGNAVYNLLIFETAATAAKTGTLNLGLVDYSMTLLIPSNNPRRRDPF